MFTRREEKRMKLDEQLMNIEDRHWREDIEKRQRREERAFQLRTMMLQQGGMGPPVPSYASLYNYSLKSLGALI